MTAIDAGSTAPVQLVTPTVVHIESKKREPGSFQPTIEEAGSGVVINSGDRIEIFDNDIADNDTANVIISSYYATGYQGQYDLADVYDPYPESIYIYGNRFSGGGESPDGLDVLGIARG